MIRKIMLNMYRPGDVEILYIRLFQQGQIKDLELRNGWRIRDRDREKDTGIFSIQIRQEEVPSIDLSYDFGLQIMVQWKDGRRYTTDCCTIPPSY